jgi:hypothetical protein
VPATRSAPSAGEVVPVIRVAPQVVRLSYTRPQAAAALGISRSTFDRRVLPLLETIEMPWGTQLVPVDELERLLTERRRAARKRKRTAAPGRPRVIAPELVERIRAEHLAGRSLAQIARDLNTARVATAHGGTRWWPSTVRAVVRRAETG